MEPNREPVQSLVHNSTIFLPNNKYGSLVKLAPQELSPNPSIAKNPSITNHVNFLTTNFKIKEFSQTKSNQTKHLSQSIGVGKI